MDTVVLAGAVGKGAVWTQGCFKPMLPLPARSTLIEALIRKLDGSTPFTCVVCSDGLKSQFETRLVRLPMSGARIEYFEDSVPLGTAGCLKACEHLTKSETVLLTGASVWLEDDTAWMLEQHRLHGNALTVFCTREPGWPAGGGQLHLRPAGLFCCDRVVIEHIRPSGFQDLKEQLVPALKRAGLRVGAVPLRGETREVSDPSMYMEILSRIITEGAFAGEGYSRMAPDIWCGANLTIAPRARIVGPALLGHDCRIDDGAVIVGPTLLGDGSHVARNARLIRVVAPHRLKVRAGMYLTDRVFPSVAAENRSASDSPLLEQTKDSTVSKSSHWRTWFRRLTSPTAAVIAALTTAFAWCFWPSISDLSAQLSSNADYGSGMLVPFAAAFMIGANRNRLKPAYRFWWPGLGLFAAGAAANVFGYLFRYSFIENVGLVTAALGLITSIFGRSLSKRLLYPLLFLFLVVPLPHRLYSAVVHPLQNWGAQIAASALETVGIPAVRMGNVIQVAGHQIAVAEACSGLRMVLAFLMVAAVITYFIERPVWQKVIVLFSSIPIALACNVFRLVLSAYLISIGKVELAEGAVHDGAGLVMMPVAIALVFLEYWVLSNLVVPYPGVSSIVEVVDDRIQGSHNLSRG